MAKFLHCADLHLGKYAYGNQTRYNDLIHAFSCTADYAIAEKLDFILISGDIFDARTINSNTLLHAVTIFERLLENEIPVYAIEGNHDRAFLRDRDSWLLFLDNRGYIRLLKPTVTEQQEICFEPYTKGQGCIACDSLVRIIGLGYPGASCAFYLTKIDEWLQKSDEYTVLMLHAGFSYIFTEESGRVDMSLLEKLMDRVDYIAMGHIHRREIMMERIYMPGSTEFIDVREAMRQDEKGFFVTDTQKGETKFVSLPPRPHVFLNVEAKGDLPIEQAILQAAGIFSNSPVVEISLWLPTLYEAFDKREMEESVARATGALSVNITALSKSGASAGIGAENMSREEFERVVLFDLLSENASLADSRKLALTAFAMELKKNAANFDIDMTLAGLLEVCSDAD